VCIALCTIVAHNAAKNRPDNFPSYPTDNHHCSDDVYLRKGAGIRSEKNQRQTLKLDTTIYSRYVASQPGTIFSSTKPKDWLGRTFPK